MKIQQWGRWLGKAERQQFGSNTSSLIQESRMCGTRGSQCSCPRSCSEI